MPALPLIALFALFTITLSLRAVVAADIPDLPSGWDYVGCLYEGNGQRIMTKDFFPSDDMTIEMCVEHCDDLGEPYAALEVGTQCFCGSKLSLFQPVSESNCDYECEGDESQQCGGYGYMSFFSLTDEDPRNSAGNKPDVPTTSMATTKAATSTKATIPVPTSTGAQKSSTAAAPTPSTGSVAGPASASGPASPVSSNRPNDSASDSSSGSTDNSAASSPDSAKMTSAAGSAPPLSQTPGFTLPDSFTGPNRSSSPTDPSGSAAAAGPTAVIMPEVEDQQSVGGNGQPRLKDESKYVVYGTYVSGSSRLTPLPYFLSALSALSMLLALGARL